MGLGAGTKNRIIYTMFIVRRCIHIYMNDIKHILINILKYLSTSTRNRLKLEILEIEEGRSP